MSDAWARYPITAAGETKPTWDIRERIENESLNTTSRLSLNRNRPSHNQLILLSYWLGDEDSNLD